MDHLQIQPIILKTGGYAYSTLIKIRIEVILMETKKLS